MKIKRDSGASGAGGGSSTPPNRAKHYKAYGYCGEKRVANFTGTMGEIHKAATSHNEEITALMASHTPGDISYYLLNEQTGKLNRVPHPQFVRATGVN